MLVDALKARITQAVKDRDDVARDVLRLAFGEAQTAEARAERPLRDDEVAQIIRKLVKSNEETLAAIPGDDARAPVLRREIAVLAELLPKGLSVAQIVEALAGQVDAIKAAKNDGQAMGVAMKHLKGAGATVEAADVTAAVKQLRS